MGADEFVLQYFDKKRGVKIVRDSDELYRTLIQLRDDASTPESVNLISPNGDVLTIALGTNFGLLQFESVLADSPYLIAIDESKRSLQTYRLVDAGGTPTPIPERACLSVEKIFEIVLYYFEHTKIPQDIEWEEN